MHHVAAPGQPPCQIAPAAGARIARLQLWRRCGRCVHRDWVRWGCWMCCERAMRGAWWLAGQPWLLHRAPVGRVRWERWCSSHEHLRSMVGMVITRAVAGVAATPNHQCVGTCKCLLKVVESATWLWRLMVVACCWLSNIMQGELDCACKVCILLRLLWYRLCTHDVQ